MKRTSASASTVQIKIVLSNEQYAHFASMLETEGCNSLTEMFRAAIFNRWPLPKTTSSNALLSSSGVRPKFVSANQEEKNEEREKSPHPPP
jgi:hypothetical protein